MADALPSLVWMIEGYLPARLEEQEKILVART
jgi:hypothetical protein